MIRYTYSTFPDQTSEAAGLASLVDDVRERGLIFVNDADARPAGAAHPLTNLWDNGSNPVAELRHVLRVHQLALDQLDTDDLMAGRLLADLEIVLVPIYLYHRYQVAATAKPIDGFEYEHATSKEIKSVVKPVPVKRQQQALDELIHTLEAEILLIPQRLLNRLPPKPFSGPNDRERFSTKTAMIFDPSTAALIAAELTLSQLLQPQRAARLAAYPQPGWSFRGVLARIVSGVFRQPADKDERSREVQRIVQRVLVERLIVLAEDNKTSESLRAICAAALRQIAAKVDSRTGNYATLGQETLLLLPRI